MLSMLETSYGIAVELKEAINALELRGVADEWKTTGRTTVSKDASWLETAQFTVAPHDLKEKYSNVT